MVVQEKGEPPPRPCALEDLFERIARTGPEAPARSSVRKSITATGGSKESIFPFRSEKHGGSCLKIGGALRKARGRIPILSRAAPPIYFTASAGGGRRSHKVTIEMRQRAMITSAQKNPRKSFSVPIGGVPGSLLRSAGNAKSTVARN